MKYLVALFLVATLALCTADNELQTNEASVPCVSTYSGVSGMLSASGSTKNLDCLYYFVPPSSEYQYVTLTFTSYNTEFGYDFTYIYDGPDAFSDVVNTFSGNLGYRKMKTSQPYATIRFTTDEAVSSQGWTLEYEFSTDQAPSCAGPRYIDNADYGVPLNYTLNGVSSEKIDCHWIIIIPNLDCPASIVMVLSSWEDSTTSLVVTAYESASTDIKLFGELVELDEYYEIDIQEAASITSSVMTSEGSFTSFVVQFYVSIYSCTDDDSSSWYGSSSWYDSSSSWYDSSSSWWYDSSSSWWWYDSSSGSGSSSSSDFIHHPRVWMIIGIAVAGVAMVGLIALFIRRRSTKSGYQKVADSTQGHYVLVPIMSQTPFHNAVNN